MEIRRPLEWHCKQMDHFVGLNFSANFNFALVGHLLKGNAALRLPVGPLSPVCLREAGSEGGSGRWFSSVLVLSAGYRHPSPTTVARTVRILHTLLSLISKHLKCDKFEVNTHSVAYLAGREASAEVTLGAGRRLEGPPDWVGGAFAACFGLILFSLLQRCSPFPRRSEVAAASNTGSLC